METTTTMENQMEKKMENEMETREYIGAQPLDPIGLQDLHFRSFSEECNWSSLAPEATLPATAARQAVKPAAASRGGVDEKGVGFRI